MNNSLSRFLLYEPALLSIIFDIFHIIEKNTLFTRIGICSKMMLAITEMIYLHISTILYYKKSCNIYKNSLNNKILAIFIFDELFSLVNLQKLFH